MIAMNNLENLATEIGKDIKDIRTRFATKDEMHEATEIDYSQVVTHEELEGKHYLTAHQSLADYAKKSEIVTPQLTLTGNTLGITGGNRVTLPLPENVGHEIRGTGSPEGRITAEIGTTYVDVNVTNGALKWIKESGNGNTGWKVLIGDTGWRTLNTLSKLTVGSRTSTIKVRRVNNLVTYHFGGLEWGWFGVIRRGGPGFSSQGSDPERNCFVTSTGGIPSGFRSSSSLMGNIYNDKGIVYGIWYLGGVDDSNHIRFQFLNPIPTDKDIGDIRVSAVSYITDEPWP